MLKSFIDTQIKKCNSEIARIERMSDDGDTSETLFMRGKLEAYNDVKAEIAAEEKAEEDRKKEAERDTSHVKVEGAFSLLSCPPEYKDQIYAYIASNKVEIKRESKKGKYTSVGEASVGVRGALGFFNGQMEAFASMEEMSEYSAHLACDKNGVAKILLNKDKNESQIRVSPIL